MTKRVYISDLHISLDARYAWLSSAEARRLHSFLTSNELADADQLVLLGDVVDLWAFPIDVRPPRFSDIMAAAHNAPILEALRALIRRGVTVVYVPGNHDMQVERADVEAVLPGAVFHRGALRDATLHAEHGHERCLFNGPDPHGNLPLGYFITRIVTTGEVRNGRGVKVDLWTILKNADHVLAIVGGREPLGTAVLDLCLAQSGVDRREAIVMPDGQQTPIADLYAAYADLFTAWDAKPGRNSAREAVVCEWDPFYGLPSDGRIKLSIAGHSHDHIFSYRSSDDTLYLNTGAWCAATSHFARTWTERGVLWGALYEWNGTRARRVNRAGVDVR